MSTSTTPRGWWHELTPRRGTKFLAPSSPWPPFCQHVHPSREFVMPATAMRRTIVWIHRNTWKGIRHHRGIGRWGWGDLRVQTMFFLSSLRPLIPHRVRATSSEAWNLRGVPTNRRCDIYSKGRTAWCICGEWAFPWWSTLKLPKKVLAFVALLALSRILSCMSVLIWPSSRWGRYLTAFSNPCTREWRFAYPLSWRWSRTCDSSNRCCRGRRSWRWCRG